MRYEKAKGGTIKPKQLVQVKRMNSIIEIRAIAKKSMSLSKIKKLSKTEYVNTDTGEIHEYKQSLNRSESTESLKNTFKVIRDLINNNFSGQQNELHHTITYAENVQDTKRLYRDFDQFWKRYKRKYGDNIDYMSIVEPQGRGAWHIHLLVRHNEREKIYIDNSEIALMWGHGFTKTTRTNSVDNLGAYLSAYLGNAELTSETLSEAVRTGAEIITREIDGVEKKFVKGARLHFYPSGMNIYRHSRGIKSPEVQEMTYTNAKKIVGDVTPNYSSTVTIYGDDEAELNKITYEQYNLKRTN